eukprot:TRINITY_DN1707_c0_g1_i1.p1 TRINITY_DN1707_c0_g1~~TRINITY_DN1707_c0_g1_i1.p1  ORF type:complete len:157 (-),score=15.26 TRINITY_DN1707_c0_g1_i1:535-1005(-)
MGFYGRGAGTVFDPALTAAQILALQCLFYLFLGAFSAMSDLIFNAAISVDQVFEWSVVSFGTASGRAIISASLINSSILAVALVFIVHRAKSVLDFTATIYFLHFLMCLLFSGFPSNWLWWLLQLVCFGIQTLLGEYLCVRREIREMPIIGATTIV